MLRSLELIGIPVQLLQAPIVSEPPNPIDVVISALPNLLVGAGITLALALVSFVFGLVFGSLLALARLSSVKFLSIAARVYIDFVRGTPLLVQIFIIYFGLPSLVQSFGGRFSFDRFVAAIIALSLNCAAYIAEIVRAGIQSIELGQREASQSLGMGPVQTMRYVVFPQALRRMIPPLGNDFISMLKDTSLVAVIGLEEVFKRGQLVVADTFLSFQIYVTVAFIYLVMTLLSSQLLNVFENRMNPVERARKKQARQAQRIA